MSTVDTARIVDGVVFQVWCDRTIEQALTEGAEEGQDLVVVARDGSDDLGGPVRAGQLWDGESLSEPPPPPEPPRRISTDRIVQRLTDADKAAAFMAALTATPSFMLRWISSPFGFLANDEQLIDVLAGIDADPAEILAA